MYIHLETVTSRFFVRFVFNYLICVYMCLYVINYLCVYFWLGLVDFGVRRVL